MDRRTFVTLGGYLPLLGACSAGFAVARRDGHTIVMPPAAVGEREWALVEHPGELLPIAVLRDGPRVVALLTRCTHRGCQVEADGVGLQCPCHGSQYDMSGRVLKGPAERSLTRYEVTMRADEIRIHLDRVMAS